MIGEYVSRAISNTEISLCAVSVSFFVSFLTFYLRSLLRDLYTQYCTAGLYTERVLKFYDFLIAEK